MADEIRLVDYYHMAVSDKPGEAARVLNSLQQAGINLLGFSAFPHGARRSQLDFLPENSAAFAKAARKLGLKLSGRRRGFLIQGAERPGAAAAVASRLARAGINVTAFQAACAGGGRYGGLLWVKPADVRKAAKVLAGAPRETSPEISPTADAVDEALEETFPASDPPAWMP
jgi:hypothetical protein